MSELSFLGKMIAFIIVAQILVPTLLPNAFAAFFHYLGDVWTLLLLVGILLVILGGGKFATKVFMKMCGLVFEVIKALIIRR